MTASQYRGKPKKKAAKKGRICGRDDCNVVLSVYNDQVICSKCWNATPLNERPYRYTDGF